MLGSNSLCPPAFIYLVYCAVQMALDVMKGYYNTAFMKLVSAFIFTLLLQYLCQTGLGVISWIIVFIPFLLMTVIVSVLLLVFGLDPKSGKLKVISAKKKQIIADGDKVPHTHKHDHKEGEQVHIHKKDKYGVDKVETEEVDYDKQKIQQSSESGSGKKNRNSNFGVFTKYSNSTDGRRRSYAIMIRDIMIDLGLTDDAARFYNDSDVCINKNTDEEFEICIRRLAKQYASTLSNSRTGKKFIERLKARNILSPESS